MFVIWQWNRMCCSENMTRMVRSIHRGCYEHQGTHFVKCSIWKSMISGNPLVKVMQTSPILPYNMCSKFVTVLQSIRPSWPIPEWHNQTFVFVQAFLIFIDILDHKNCQPVVLQTLWWRVIYIYIYKTIVWFLSSVSYHAPNIKHPKILQN